MRTCRKCKEVIKELDEIVLLDDYDDTVYHADCVQIYPSRWAVYDGKEYLGMSEDGLKEA